MRSSVLLLLLALLGVVLCARAAPADCDSAASNADDGEVTTWFKNLGCKIQKGAGDLSDAAKPYANKIGEAAKDIGSSVAQKYDDLKHKLTDDNAPGAAAAGSALTPQVSAPTEKVPLAPLSGGPAAPAAAGVAGERTSAAASSGEQTTTIDVPPEPATPRSIDDRFLFQLNECPDGMVLDHQKHCRKKN